MLILALLKKAKAGDADGEVEQLIDGVEANAAGSAGDGAGAVGESGAGLVAEAEIKGLGPGPILGNERLRVPLDLAAAEIGEVVARCVERVGEREDLAGPDAGRGRHEAGGGGVVEGDTGAADGGGAGIEGGDGGAEFTLVGFDFEGRDGHPLVFAEACGVGERDGVGAGEIDDRGARGLAGELEGKTVDAGETWLPGGRAVFENELEFAGLADGEGALNRIPADGLGAGGVGDHKGREAEQEEV